MFGVYWLKAISGWRLLRARTKKVPKKGCSVVPFKIGCYLFWSSLRLLRARTKKVPKKGYSVVPFKIGCYLFWYSVVPFKIGCYLFCGPL